MSSTSGKPKPKREKAWCEKKVLERVLCQDVPHGTSEYLHAQVLKVISELVKITQFDLKKSL
jgi:hypothetical protein